MKLHLNKNFLVLKYKIFVDFTILLFNLLQITKKTFYLKLSFISH